MDLLLGGLLMWGLYDLLVAALMVGAIPLAIVGEAIAWARSRLEAYDDERFERWLAAEVRRHHPSV